MNAASVDAYVASAPPDQQGTLRLLRALLQRHLGACTRESLGSSGFPVRTLDDAWVAGFAWRKKGPMLYVMNAGLLDRYAERLGPLRSGRSCVEWRATRRLSLEALTALVEELLGEEARRLGR